MDAERYNRSIALVCSTCGGKDFEFEDDEGPVRCTGCDRVFTRDELVQENGEAIEAEVDELKAEVFKDIQRDFSDSLRKAFRGSKHIKIR